jgi:hypothetical protein
MNRTNPRGTSHPRYENDGKRCRPSHSPLPPASGGRTDQILGPFHLFSPTTALAFLSHQRSASAPGFSSVGFLCALQVFSVNSVFRFPLSLSLFPFPFSLFPVSSFSVLASLVRDPDPLTILPSWPESLSFRPSLVSCSRFAIDFVPEDTWTFDLQLSAKSANSKDS